MRAESVDRELAVALPRLLPLALSWAEACAAEIAATGQGLAEQELAVARRVGVRLPERIRIKTVDRIALPVEPALRTAALRAGLLNEGTIGLTLGYGIYLRAGRRSARLIAHECRHIFQYEQAGSIARYMPLYSQQIIEYGYRDAPFEVDARLHEVEGASPTEPPPRAAR